MKILLPTSPAFLQANFAPTRQALRGLPTTIIDINYLPGVGLQRFNLKRAAHWVLTAISFLAVVFAGILLVPDLYFRFWPTENVKVVAEETPSALGAAESHQVLPPKNENLPEGNWISIPRIGVRTEIQTTQNPEEALQTGVWMSPEYGSPQNNNLPIIMAAHRYGWEWWWQSEYWKYNSFYYLPDTEPGDLVEVIVDQRKWVYEIYEGEEGNEITDYEADIILYTCKFLNSPVRHFRYARLVDLEKDTQVRI